MFWKWDYLSVTPHKILTTSSAGISLLRLCFPRASPWFHDEHWTDICWVKEVIAFCHYLCHIVRLKAWVEQKIFLSIHSPQERWVAKKISCWVFKLLRQRKKMEAKFFLRTSFWVFREQKRQEMVEDRIFSYSAHLLMGLGDCRSFLERHHMKNSCSLNVEKAKFSLVGK